MVAWSNRVEPPNPNTTVTPPAPHIGQDEDESCTPPYHTPQGTTTMSPVPSSDDATLAALVTCGSTTGSPSPQGETLSKGSPPGSNGANNSEAKKEEYTEEYTNNVFELLAGIEEWIDAETLYGEWWEGSSQLSEKKLVEFLRDNRNKSIEDKSLREDDFRATGEEAATNKGAKVANIWALEFAAKSWPVSLTNTKDAALEKWNNAAEKWNKKQYDDLDIVEFYRVLKDYYGKLLA
eukprot:GHVO01066200.1.p1 GENE.GHVO01066200.1~~GHVO01066200.1.p1  ORF type:complete len:236 (+),score=43.65 GHVO01066200.1:348-1055(+)